MTLRLKSLRPETAALLEADDWTIGKLATAAVKDLTGYKGIGKVGAGKIISEAADLINAQRLNEAEGMAREYYYQKAPLAKILDDWEAEGLTTRAVALTSARALAALKGVDETLALRLISKAQGIVNKRGLYQSQAVTADYSVGRQTSSAFDERWLSGEIEPPAMSVRVRRNFKAAQKEYRANG